MSVDNKLSIYDEDFDEFVKQLMPEKQSKFLKNLTERSRKFKKEIDFTNIKNVFLFEKVESIFTKKRAILYIENDKIDILLNIDFATGIPISDAEFLKLESFLKNKFSNLKSGKMNSMTEFGKNIMTDVLAKLLGIS